MVAASTPATTFLKRHDVAHTVHSYVHDDRADSFGAEAADILGARLGVRREQIFKTLIIECADRSLAVAVLPVTGMLSLKAAAAALGSRKVVMADKAAAERSSGYVFGGISPLGQRRLLPTVVDDSALQFDRILCSAGKRGLEIELDPRDLIRSSRATTAPITAP